MAATGMTSRAGAAGQLQRGVVQALAVHVDLDRPPGIRDAREGLLPKAVLALGDAALDVDAPAALTYGFRPEARAALVAWLRGEAGAPGRLPFGA